MSPRHNRPKQRHRKNPFSKPFGKKSFSRPQTAGPSFKKVKATVDKHHKGFAFLIFGDKEVEDLFIPPRDAARLFHGDRVEVTLNSKREVLGLRVLSHRFRELIGRFTPMPTRAGRGGGFVVYERKQNREEVYAPHGASKAKAGDWVKAKLHFHDKGPFPVTAEVTEIYGPTLPASADISLISSEYGLIEAHAPEAEHEAKLYLQRFRGEESPHSFFQGRKDLRKTPFITIDGEDARDFDDAVYVERIASGHRLWVAIADVSHYVTPGSALDQEAQARGTSVYFPERAFHMLPSALSEHLCSLRPNEPRLALVARIDFSSQGHPTHTEVMEAVIRSHRRATYTEIQTEWQANSSHKNWEFAPHFELFQLIKQQRLKRGSMDFDLPEVHVLVDQNGEPASIRRRERLDTHRLIEEFMISANEAVTEWVLKKSWPFIFRIHEEPAEQSLLKFQKLAATVGVHVSLSEENLTQTLSDLIRRLENHPAQGLLNMALLRSMKQAVYSATHAGHFGLASKAYTHFTSPIRRYPDLVVHRILRQVLQSERSKKSSPQLQEKELTEIAEHCSYRERLASDAERESIRLKQVRAMLPHLGDEFDAKVVGMTEGGIFVQITDPYVEGMVTKDSMTDDFYEFNEERMVFSGRRKRRTFQIGSAVRVITLRADLDRRQIDFGLATPSSTGQTSPRRQK